MGKGRFLRNSTCTIEVFWRAAVPADTLSPEGKRFKTHVIVQLTGHVAGNTMGVANMLHLPGTET